MMSGRIRRRSAGTARRHVELGYRRLGLCGRPTPGTRRVQRGTDGAARQSPEEVAKTVCGDSCVHQIGPM